MRESGGQCASSASHQSFLSWVDASRVDGKVAHPKSECCGDEWLGGEWRPIQQRRQPQHCDSPNVHSHHHSVYHDSMDGVSIPVESLARFFDCGICFEGIRVAGVSGEGMNGVA